MRILLWFTGLLAFAVGFLSLAVMRTDIQVTIVVVAFCSGVLMFGVAHAIGIARRIETKIKQLDDWA